MVSNGFYYFYAFYYTLELGGFLLAITSIDLSLIIVWKSVLPCQLALFFYSSVLLWIFLLSFRQKAYQKALFWILSFCILYMILLTSIQQFSLLQFTQFEGVLEFLKKLSVITFWCLLVISGISILLFWIVFYCRRTSFTSFICSRLYLEEEAKKNYC